VYWHFWPAYALLLAVARIAFLQQPPARASRLARAALGALAFLTLLPWLVFLPVPELARPGGPYAVGTLVFRWIDPTRPETRTDAPDDLRNVVVQAWYPAAAGAHGSRAPYIDGIGHLPRFVSLFPGLAMAYYDRIDTHAVGGALPAPQRSRWPVVVFSPGYGAPRAFYTGLVTDLASRGFVVLAVDHPYEVAVTELVGGRIATAIERIPSGHGGWPEYMTRQQGVRTADLRFVLDRIAQPGSLGALSGHLDLDHVASVGHSFGGAAAVQSMADDPRIAAAANIDGTLYGALPEQHLPRPVLLLESDRQETGHSPAYVTGNQRLLHNRRAAAYRFEIHAANHFSFTDGPLFFSPPARLALALCIGGSRGVEDTQRAAIDILAAFLATSLGLSPADVEAAAARHGNITGGRVPASTAP
jgi:predicted dienelactone hydrolase